MKGAKRSEWRSEADLEKSARSLLVEQSEILEERRKSLDDYAAGKSCFRGGYGAGGALAYEVAQSLLCSVRYRCEATVKLFSAEPGWQELLEKSSAYNYWSLLIQYRSAAETAPLSFSNAVKSLADCIFWGWLEEAEFLANEILFLYQNRRFSDVRLIYSQPLNHWFLKICFAYLDLSFDGWGRGFHGDDVRDVSEGASRVAHNLDCLLADWFDKDASSLVDDVEWLCDYYVSRTRLIEGCEFSNDLIAVRMPILILAGFRLRQVRELQIPWPKHPLFSPGYVFLPESRAMYSDDVLSAAVSRLRDQEIVGLGWIHSSRSSDGKKHKQGLLQRLFGSSSGRSE